MNRIRMGRCVLCKLAVLAAWPLVAQVPASPVFDAEDDPFQAAGLPNQPIAAAAVPGALPDAPGWTLPAPPPLLPPCPKQPATAKQKGYLALHNYLQPGNLITIVGTAAFTIGTNSHTAYGPGWAGWGRNTGYSFSQDATGEFFGTFLIPSLLHEDPHYHREPNASIPRRIFHAVSRTAVAQHDNGTLMLNYATLLTYPISAEISNLYVPGVNGNAPSTAARIATGLATDPVNNIITEFLPDLAKHINIRVIFVQRILNAVVAGNVSGGSGAVAGP